MHKFQSREEDVLQKLELTVVTVRHDARSGRKFIRELYEAVVWTHIYMQQSAANLLSVRAIAPIADATARSDFPRLN